MKYLIAITEGRHYSLVKNGKNRKKKNILQHWRNKLGKENFVILFKDGSMIRHYPNLGIPGNPYKNGKYFKSNGLGSIRECDVKFMKGFYKRVLIRAIEKDLIIDERTFTLN